MDTTATLVPVMDPTTVSVSVAVDEPAPEPPASHHMRRSIAIFVIGAIICGAAALAFALIAGSLAP